MNERADDGTQVPGAGKHQEVIALKLEQLALWNEPIVLTRSLDRDLAIVNAVDDQCRNSDSLQNGAKRPLIGVEEVSGVRDA